MSDLMPKEWILGKASDFVVSPQNDIVDGPFGSNLKASEYQLSGTPIIRLQNIKRLRFINKNIKYVSNEKAIELSRHSYKKGDIVITKLGDPLGLACIIPENFQDGVIVADLVRLRINDLAFDKQYLTYLLNSPLVISQLNKHIKGTTRPRINLGIIRDLNLPIASISEQKIIAEKLDTLLAQVDSTKARLEQIPQILKRFRQAVLAAAVNGNLNKNAKPNTKVRTLQDVGIIIKTGPFGSALHKSDYISNGIPVINPMHINDGIISPSLSMTISDKKYAELSSWSLQDGDVIVGRRGEMGRAAVVNIGQSKMLCGTGSMILRTNSNINSKYLELILRSPIAISYFNKEAVGSTMVNLNQKVINSLEVYLPNIEEQQGIVRRVEQLFAWADTIEKQVNNALTRVNSLTQSILAKAFRGELTAQWRADNPDLISGENSAAALLEKIKAERAASGGKKTSRKKA
ncbi:restriction endonuclease subunit S [Salmonella enterica subsp. enterica]|nr:restriction endonuclease subunit S [Salmonella enterica subsp. enterica]EJW2000753.1 restriction endonuclease subunit S [Salmonella enterica]EJW2034094.1 restriction endonuclease subunit S [Salmonella enterica]EJW2038638.1 restriction endonuclease subunit S [Salmonella enterica]EJW2068084.1 restriction endonuclease subunit S [Salmonella enterica]